MQLGVYYMDLPTQRLDEYAIMRFSDPTDRWLDESILSILWEIKNLPTSTVTCFPVLITLKVS